MLLRELRSSWRRLVFFFVCVSIGVGAIVSLRSLIQNIEVALTTESRTLVAGDVYLQSGEPWTNEVLQILKNRLSNVSSFQRTEIVDTTTMARWVNSDSTSVKVVELRGLEAEFPFYGEFKLGSEQDYSFEILKDYGALVGPELLNQMGIEIGEKITIGEIDFTVRGTVLQEPGGQLGAFNFGPRVLIDREALNDTGILTFGSRANYRILLKLHEAEIGMLVEHLSEDLDSEFIRVGSYRNTESRIERYLTRTENYLSLVGFVIVILGGIGVWSVMRIFVQQRLNSIAVLKCLGATTGRVLSVYIAQVAILGLFGSLLGIFLANVAMASVPASLTQEAAEVAGFSIISTQLTDSAILQGLVVGVFASLLFALIPLLEVQNVKPLILLQQNQNKASSSFYWLRILIICLVVVLLLLIASWQANSMEVGFYVVGGFVCVSLVLHLLGLGLMASVAPLETTRWFSLRHAALNLRRPGNQTRIILLSVGLGSFFIVGVRSLQANLLNNFALELREDTPDMFLIDIQDDQADDVTAILKKNINHEPQLVPVLQARVIGVKGRVLSLDSASEARRAGLGREYTVTYRSHLEENERIIAGSFWDEESSTIPEVSIEESLYERRDIQLGDTVKFDVLGREFQARVTSIRAVDWDDSRSGGFMFLFSPGFFDDAPHTFIGFLKGPSDVSSRANLQREIAEKYPNVSIIDGLDILSTVRRVLDYVTLAITVVGLIALLSGSLILIGSVAMTKFQRIYEAAIFRTLGANTKTLTATLIFEYGVLGIIAGTVGSFGALLLTWVLVNQVFDLAWLPALSEHLVGILLTAVIVCAVGVLSSLDVLQRKPLAILRAE